MLFRSKLYPFLSCKTRSESGAVFDTTPKPCFAVQVALRCHNADSEMSDRESSSISKVVSNFSSFNPDSISL